MLGDILHFHRTEGAKADMQGYMGDLYTGILYLLQKLIRKMLRSELLRSLRVLRILSDNGSCPAVYV